VSKNRAKRCWGGEKGGGTRCWGKSKVGRGKPDGSAGEAASTRLIADWISGKRTLEKSQHSTKSAGLLDGNPLRTEQRPKASKRHPARCSRAIFHLKRC